MVFGDGGGFTLALVFIKNLRSPRIGLVRWGWREKFQAGLDKSVPLGMGAINPARVCDRLFSASSGDEDHRVQNI